VRPGDRLQIHEFHPEFSWKESGDSGSVSARAFSFRVLFYEISSFLDFKNVEKLVLMPIA
jgi:hypothetical protein